VVRTAIDALEPDRGPLPPLPAGLDDSTTGIVHGLFAGRTTADPLAYGPRTGRSRRWCYAAAGGEEALVGAAIVHLGVVGVAFAWAQIGARTYVWERRAPLGRGITVGRGFDAVAAARLTGARLQLDPDGGFRIDVPVGSRRRLTASVRAGEDVTPIVATIATPGGGWNATQKAAGYEVDGWVRLSDDAPVALGARASGWRDATTGRQDRVTTWRWACGGGTGGGQRVGFTTSTGWRDEPWEDVVWWDGVPHHLPVERLQPQDDWDPTGDWVVSGPGWELWFEPRGVRAKDEKLVLATSRYVQPIGTFAGTLPDPSGQPVEVRLAGVTEDHYAVW
jgi:hypothetical protein